MIDISRTKLIATLALAALAGGGSPLAQTTANPAAAVTNTASYQEQQDLDFADGLYQRGMYESAARQYDDFLQKHPGSPNRETALFRKAESLYQHASSLNEQDPLTAKVIMVEARGALLQLLESFPQGEKRLDAQLRLGEIGYKIGDTEGGLNRLLEVIEKSQSPTLIEAALFYGARCYDRLGQPDKAETFYRRIKKDYPKGDFAAYSTFLLGELLAKQDRLGDAIEVLNGLWKKPGDYKIEEGSSLPGDAQLLAAQLLYRQNQYADAAKAYRAFAQTHPDGSQTARAQYGAAWAEYQQENYAAALDVAKALKTQFLPADMLPGILFLQGACSYQQKQYADAVGFFRETIADPNAGEYRARAWYQLAWSYYLSGDYNQAEVECRNLLRTGIAADIAAKLHFLLGQTYAQRENYRDAIEELKQVELTDPQCQYNEDALYLRADLLYRNEQYSEASQAFERYYNDYSRSDRAQQALIWAANARFAAKEYPQAIELADKLIAAYPELPSMHDTLYRKALAQYHLKQYDDALVTLTALLHSERGDERKPEALYWTAYIYEMKELPSKASEIYGELLNRYPDFKQAEEVKLRRAFCDYQTEDYQNAYDQFQAVLTGPKQNDVPVEILFWMVVFADENDRHEDALNTAETILKLHDEPAVTERARIAQGNQLIALKRWDDAEKTARTFIEKYPQSLFTPEIDWVLAKALEGKGDFAKAAELFEKSLLGLQDMANPDPEFEAKIYLDLGRSLDRHNKTKEALDAFLRVAILFDHPRLTPEAMYRAVGAHLKLDQPGEAATLMDELAEKYPDSTWTAKAREEYKDIAAPAAKTN
ncbi:MAG: tetratricopeptide repeat protein [bacterium]|nr:tetratricopeptide repeat protein [bacterium]